LAQKYKQEMDAYRKAQDEAKKEMPKIQATITQDETQLKKIADDLETKQAPITDKFKTTSDEMGALLRQANTLAAKIQNMEAAMRAAPDDLRFAHGIVEWEGVFYPLADLEKLYTETQAEIVRVNQQMKAEADAAGRPLPANWRHPQQDRMDTLKALLDHAKKGHAAK
jgi:DNA repair exonuclease SbcCD ATPase subunit